MGYKNVKTFPTSRKDSSLGLIFSPKEVVSSPLAFSRLSFQQRSSKDDRATPFVPRERLLEKQRYFQNVHKHTYLKGPYDKITSVAIPLALAATTGFMIARGIYNYVSWDWKEGIRVVSPLVNNCEIPVLRRTSFYINLLGLPITRESRDCSTVQVIVIGSADWATIVCPTVPAAK